MAHLFPLHKSKSRFIVVMLLFFFTWFFQVSLCSCAFSPEKEAERMALRPYAFPGSTWESTDPEIKLYVSMNEGDSIVGYVNCGDENIDIVLSLTQGNNATVFDREKYEKAISCGGNMDEGTMLMRVRCEYTAEKIIMTVEEDHLFEGLYDTIILYRTQ